MFRNHKNSLIQLVVNGVTRQFEYDKIGGNARNGGNAKIENSNETILLVFKQCERGASYGSKNC